MTHGFNLDDPLVCEGIIGDGCGGGRLFYIEESTLKSYDPFTKEAIILLEDIQNTTKVSKQGCVVSIKTTNEVVKFDLSLLKKI